MLWSESPEIMQFLRQNGHITGQNAREVVLFCPYCGDRERSANPTHGHLYVSIQNSVFYCFRCQAAGVVTKLLRDLDFPDPELLKRLGVTTPLLNVRKEHGSLLRIGKETPDGRTLVHQRCLQFRQENPQMFREFQKYLYSRFGNYFDYERYLLFPKIDDGKNISIGFLNKEGEYVGERILNPVNKGRKYRIGASRYFFQNLNFDKYIELVVCEGQFDAISLYRYGEFHKERTFFMAISGKRFLSETESFIESFLKLGPYKIHFVFDKDDQSRFRRLYLGKRIFRRLNPEIELHGYEPIVGKDVGTDVSIVEIQGRKHDVSETSNYY